MNRFTFLLISLLYIYSGPYLAAQDKNTIDSLENELKIKTTPGDQCNLQVKLSREFLTSNPEKALSYALKAYTIAEENLEIRRNWK